MTVTILVLCVRFLNELTHHFIQSLSLADREQARTGCCSIFVVPYEPSVISTFPDSCVCLFVVVVRSFKMCKMSLTSLNHVLPSSRYLSHQSKTADRVAWACLLPRTMSDPRSIFVQLLSTLLLLLTPPTRGEVLEELAAWHSIPQDVLNATHLTSAQLELLGDIRWSNALVDSHNLTVFSGIPEGVVCEKTLW